jgi:hypothetical protein
VSKPIEDSLVETLAREHAARRAHIEAEAALLLGPSDTHVDIVPPMIDAAPLDVAPPAIGAAPPIDAAAAPPRPDASSPRLLVEELTRKCCERRAALDEEARRG